MSGDDLHARERLLDQAFYRGGDQALRFGLMAGVPDGAAGELGVTDTAVFGRLRESDVAGETVAALTLIPVVAVAWADGALHGREREALLKAAESAGIAAGSASQALLDSWFREAPDPELFERWKSFIVALCVDMPVGEVEALRAELLHRAHAVAKAAGGLLGFGRVSAREREILTELEHAFPA